MLERAAIKHAFDAHVHAWPHGRLSPVAECERNAASAVSLLLLAVTMMVEMMEEARGTGCGANRDVHAFSAYMSEIHALDVAALSRHIHADLQTLLDRASGLFQRTSRLVEHSLETAPA